MKTISNDANPQDDLISHASEAISFFQKILYEIDKGSFDEEAGEVLSFSREDVRKLSLELEDYIDSRVSLVKNDKNYRDSDFIHLFQFALVALIDDLLISKDWSGKSAWSEELIELKLFATRSAGDVFYDNCNRILNNRATKYRELAYVYYLCLVAGFRGKLFQSSNYETLETLKNDLYKFYFEGNKSQGLSETKSLLPNSRAAKNSKRILLERTTFFVRLWNFNYIFIFVFIFACLVLWFVNKALLYSSLSN